MPGGVLYLDLTHTISSELSFNWSDLATADTNCSYGIHWMWTLMGQCVMDTRGYLALVCGFVCLATLILTGIPQIVENVRTGLPDKALSPFLLLFWTLGDCSNFVGCILTRQLVLQVVISVYSLVNDIILWAQFAYYKTRHNIELSYMSEMLGEGRVYLEDDNRIHLDDEVTSSCVPSFEAPFECGTGSSRTSLLIVCSFSALSLVTVISLPSSGSSHVITKQATSGHFDVFTSRRLLHWTGTTDLPNAYSEWDASFLPGTSAKIGYGLGCFSSVMYVSSRIPQIIRNWQRGSTVGLCLGLFCLAVIGNCFYGLQIFLTSLDPLYLLRSLPWLIGSVGVVFLDFIIFFQFYYFSPSRSHPDSFGIDENRVVC